MYGHFKKLKINTGQTYWKFQELATMWASKSNCFYQIRVLFTSVLKF